MLTDVTQELAALVSLLQVALGAWDRKPAES